MTIAAAVDLNEDGDYSDTYEDISDRLITAEWELGARDQFAMVAGDSTLRLIVDNEDRRFSPEYASSPIYGSFTVDKPVRIQTTKDGTTRTMIVGWIKSIKPAPVRFGPMTTEIMVDGWLGRAALLRPLTMEVLTEVTTDEALAAIIRAGRLYPPGYVSGWRLGYGLLGHTTVLSSINDYFTYETGRATLHVVGDYGNDMSLLGAIRDAMGREGGGLFFCDREGNLVFWNSAHFPLDLTSDATFSGYFQDIDYAYGEDVRNYIVVPVRNRSIGTAPERLGFSEAEKTVPAGQAVSISYRYADPSSGGRIGGQNAITPVASVDFSALYGTSDYSTYVTATITNESGSGCTVQFSNSALVDVVLQSGSQVRGTKITDYGQQQAVATTSARVRRQWTYPGTLDDLDRAEKLAGYWLRAWSNAQGQIETLRLQPGGSDTLLQNALALTIGSRITVTESQTGLSQDYFIVGERHHWRAPRYYDVTWRLMPAASFAYWTLGASRLGIDTIPFPL